MKPEGLLTVLEWRKAVLLKQTCLNFEPEAHITTLVGQILSLAFVGSFSVPRRLTCV